MSSRLRSKRTTKPKKLVSTQHDYALLKGVHGKKRPSVRQVVNIGRILSAQEKGVFRIAVLGFIIGCIWLGTMVSLQYRQVVPKVGGTYTEAVVGEPQLINPLFASVNDVDVDISRLIYSGLLTYNNQQQLVPDLASGYTISEDKKRYTFELRKDVLWHDGTPFTARDVAFTIATIQDPLVNSPLQFGFQDVTIELIDDYTIVFVLPEAFQPFLSTLTVGILPEHIWGDVTAERMRLVNMNLQPVGTGPFQFKKLAKDQTGFVFKYELERFEQYYDSPPYIENFVFQFFGEYETDLGAIQALRQEKVDGLHFVPSSLRDRVDRKNIVIHTLQLPQYAGLFFNQKRQPVLESKGVREALALAVDKERILRESIGGEGYVIHSPLLPGTPGYKENLEGVGMDVEKANALLDEVYDRLEGEEYKNLRRDTLMQELRGEHESTVTSSVEESPEDDPYAFDTPGNRSANPDEEQAQTSTQIASETIVATSSLMDAVETRIQEEFNTGQSFYRKDADDNIVVIELVTVNTPEYTKAAQLIAAQWQELGIVTQIRVVDPKEISRGVLRERNFDVLLYGVILGADPDQYAFWHSSQAPYPGLNLAQYENRNLDTILENIRETEDQQKLEELYGSLRDTLLEDRPAVFLYTPIYRYATTDRVRGIDIDRIYLPADRFANITDWYIKTKGSWRNKQ